MVIDSILKQEKKYDQSQLKWEKRIGDILIDEGHINNAQLHEALKIQREEGGRLGWILISNGYINRLQMYGALAEKFNLPFVAEEIKPQLDRLDSNLLKDLEPEEIIEYQAIPLEIKNNKLTLLTAFPGSVKTINHFKKKYNIWELEERVITDLDISNIVKNIFKRSLQAKTILGLYTREPEESAYIRITKPQIIFLFTLLGIIGLGLWLYPDQFLIGLFATIQIFYLLSISYKFIISIAGINHKFFNEKHKEMNQEIKRYPVYTVLVPLFKEPKPVLKSIIKAIKDFDYPKNKLDVIFLFEKNDQQTINDAKSLNPPSSWRFFYVPNGTPTTKPKACNYGLYFARGKYLVIYDAEDIPEPDQLKKSLAAFQNSPDNYGCFQAFLNYYNKNENFLTRMFTLEYSYWFDYLLSGLFKFRLPIPLGGTSNHFKVDVLKKISGWDPFNVTEDADLGVRMAAENKRVGVINSTTYEEANSRYGNWIRQRSRWIKGYMQTSLVYNRNPIKLIKTLGFWNWASFQMIVTGTPFTFLVNPLMWIIFLVWIITSNLVIFPQIPEIITLLGTISLVAGNLIMVILNLAAAFSRKYWSLIPYAILNPVYWVLHSIAAYKALWQLFFRPFYWEKTKHGLSKFDLAGTKADSS